MPPVPTLLHALHLGAVVAVLLGYVTILAVAVGFTSVRKDVT